MFPEMEFQNTTKDGVAGYLLAAARIKITNMLFTTKHDTFLSFSKEILSYVDCNRLSHLMLFNTYYIRFKR